MTGNGEQDKARKIEKAIKEEGDKVEPQDKDALAKIRRRTGGDKRGNGGGKRREKGQ